MLLLEICVCLLACALGGSAQGPGLFFILTGGARGGLGNQTKDGRFTWEVGPTPLPFDEARRSCGEKKYLLNLQVYGKTLNTSEFQRHGLEDSLVWLNLRIVEGFFHWLDPVPRLFRREDTSYGKRIVNSDLKRECAVLNASLGVIQTRSCEEKHRFVCIEDKMFQLLSISEGPVRTRLTSNRSPILLSYNLYDLLLICRAYFGNGTILTTPAPGRYTYVWTKNGVFLNHNKSSLLPDQLSQLNVYTYSKESIQGAYKCGLKALPSGNITWSEVVSVVLEDFNTHLLTGDLSRNYASKPIQFISYDFSELARTIGAALRQPGFNASWSYSGITVENNGAVKISIFVYSKRREIASVAAGLQAPLNVTTAASALQHIIVNATITDVLHCEDTQQGPFNFSSDRNIGFVESSPPCITESGRLVPRICKITFRSKPTWATFNESKCSVAPERHTGLDFHMDEHYLVCNDKHCRAKLVNGSWHEAWQSCNDMRGFLKSYGNNTWTDLVRKNGYIQFDSTGDPTVLEYLRRSELLPPIVLNQPADQNACFVQSRLNGSQNAENIARTLCTETHGAKCAFRYQRSFRSLDPCPKGGWLDMSNRTRCLWLELEPLSNDGAVKRCNASGGTLAVLEDTSLESLTLLLLPPDVPRKFDSFWIGLAKTSSGNFTWSNKKPLQHFSWHPRTDYQLSAGTLHVDRYSAEDEISLRLSLENPRLRLPSICEAPLSAGAPWLRVQRIDIGTNITLVCRMSAEVLPGSVLWYKDGIAVQGDRAHTSDGEGTTLIIERATSDSPYLQGYYWCEGLNVADFLPVASSQLFVRFQDVKSYGCSTYLDRNYPAFYDFSTWEFYQFTSKFRNGVLDAIKTRRISDFDMHDLRVVNVMDDGSGVDVVRFLVYFKRIQGHPRTRRNTKDGVEEEQLLMDWLNATLVTSNITIPLTAAPYIRLNSFSVHSTEMCLREVTAHSHSLQNTLTWPKTPIGGVATPNETCIQADGKPTVRRCEGNFTVGAYWGDVQGSCEQQATQRTLDLRTLSLEEVTNGTMDPVADRLRELTADSHSLGSQDIVYVAKTLENIVSAGPVSEETAKGIASTIDHVLRADTQILQQSRPANTTNRILAAMESASAGLETTGTRVFSGSVAIAKVSRPKHPLRGVAIHRSKEDIYEFSEPTNLTEGTDAALLLPEHWDTNAPDLVLDVGLMNSSALLQETTAEEVMYNISNTTESSELCSPILQLKYASDAKAMTTENMTFSFYFKPTCHFVPEEVDCVFWDSNANRQLGSWSSDGCEYGGKMNEYHICNCTHLSTFAMLFKSSDRNQMERGVHGAVLGYLTYIGVSVSAACLFLVVMTYVLFKKWRKGVGHQVLFNLCLSLLGALASFVALAALPKHRTSPASCTCVGAGLHYFLLVSFAWTFVESLLQYLRFVRVLGTYVPNLVLKAAFGAWGVPMLVILSVLIVNPTEYHKRKDICWLDREALLYSFLLPVGLILTANVVVFSVVVFSIYCRRQKGLRSTQSQVDLAKAQLRATVCIVFLLGLTWIFAYLSLLEEVSIAWGHLFEYLFVGTSSLQGLVIFIFHVAYDKTAREFWLGQIVYGIWPFSRKRSVDHESTKITFSSLTNKTTST
ncbi:uncharacterized protein LOC144141029 isoform X3 [Haemaphysalis longicornis]